MGVAQPPQPSRPVTHNLTPSRVSSCAPTRTTGLPAPTRRPASSVPLSGSAHHAARKICAECDVRPECLEWALAQSDNPEGIFGGTTKTERAATRLVRSGGYRQPATPSEAS